MTIGQRIAEKRKELGLSQEALGEKLGVSRQAISKWESDASVPEIDKLIVLSKLFGVSVGWLLGVEETQGETPELSQGTEPSLWQALLAYLKTLPGLRKLGILLLVLVQLFLYWQLLRCYNTANEAWMYAGFAESATDRLELDLKAVQEALAQRQEVEPGTLLSGYSFDTVRSEDGMKGTITFSAVPYSWQEGDAAYLCIQGRGIPTVQIPCQWDGAFLSCATVLELRSGMEFCFLLEYPDGSRQLQMLYDDYLQNTDFAAAPLIIGSVENAEYDPQEKCFTALGLEVNYSRSESYEDTGITWQTIALLLLADGEEVARSTFFDANIRQDSTLTGGGMGYGHGQRRIPDVTLIEGQTVTLVAYADFSNGISSQETIASWTLGPDASLIPIP